MAYCRTNFKTKKAMKAAVAAGERVTVFQPGMLGPPVSGDHCSVEGPHYPEAHRWYASVLIATDEGSGEKYITKVKS